MATSTISSGVVSSGLVVSAADVVTVLSGGTAEATTVDALGTLLVSSGGLASGTTVNYSGLEQIASGGTASATLISTSGQEFVSGTDSGSLDSGGTQTVFAGGVATGTNVQYYGQQIISSGGVASQADVADNGDQIISSGGVAVSATLEPIVLFPGFQSVYAGGTAIGTTVFQGDAEDVYGGVTSGSVLSGGVEVVGATLGSGPSVEGVASNTTIATSGTLLLDVGGSAAGSITFAGSGATLEIHGSSMPTVPISGFAATDVIDLRDVAYSGGGSASFSGGVLTVTEGGQSYSLDLPGLPNGTTFTLFPGPGSGTVVFLNTGSSVTISSGVVSSGLVVSAADVLTVLSGGTADATTVDTYGTLIVSSGGSVSGTTVSFSGLEQIAGGATASATVNDGGYEFVSGAAFGSVESGGTQTVLAGGAASQTDVQYDSLQIITSGGVAVSTFVNGGGYQFVSVGGTAIGTTASYDAFEYISGGITSGTVLSGGTEFVAANSGAGPSVEGIASNTTIATGGSLVLEVGGSAAGSISFAGSSGTLDIFGSSMPTVPISGFATTDQIDLRNVAYTGSGSATFNDGVLTVTEGGQSYTLDLPDLPNGTTFALVTDVGSGTTVLASTIPCFVEGTEILTSTGDVPVQHLAVGDLLITENGEAQPIVWIGHRRVDLRRHPHPDQVRPVRIAAHAFGRNKPSRDLYLSPDHAVFAEGVLIPIKHLIDGLLIQQIDIDRVTYFHVELAEHSVVFAQGLPAESYLDTGDRASFAGGEIIDMHPAFGREAKDVSLIADALGYAPLRVLGPEVERVQLELSKRAADGSYGEQKIRLA